MMKAEEFIEKAKNICENLNTLYVLGAFGAPGTTKSKNRYGKQAKNACRKDEIYAATDDTFFFDCIGMIKGILWGFKADKTKTYGGSVYVSNGVPDKGANSMIKVCMDISTDFSTIVPGEVVWMDGHIGVYIGEGLVAECTSAWESKAMITKCSNVTSSSKAKHSRKWTKHAKLPYVEYPAIPEPVDEDKIEVGDKVTFIGTVQYSNSSKTSGTKAKSCTATVKQIYKLGKSKHPYLIKGTGVYGWVDEADVVKK